MFSMVANPGGFCLVLWGESHCCFPAIPGAVCWTKLKVPGILGIRAGGLQPLGKSPPSTAAPPWVPHLPANMLRARGLNAVCNAVTGGERVYLLRRDAKALLRRLQTLRSDAELFAGMSGAAGGGLAPSCGSIEVALL